MDMEAGTVSQRTIHFLVEEDGQDIIEYSLLICFLAVVGIWVVIGGREPIEGMWNKAQSHLSLANTSAS